MIEWLTHRSAAIADFPMGDAAERSFPVYLPPDYATSGDGYPVIFMLTGFGSKGVNYAYNVSAFSLSLPQRLDQAIAKGECPPCIIVFPDGASKLGCSQYINSPAFGHYEDYFCEELVALIDVRYNTRATKNYRGVMGHSSGGFGALIYAMHRADVFAYICSSAGDSFFEVSLMPNVTPCLIELEKAGGIKSFVDTFLSHPNPGGMSKHAFVAMLTLAMAPCFAPNLEQADIYGDLFFDTKTGAIIPEVWARYLEWDPVHKVQRHQDALRSLKWLHLAAGAQDEYALQLGHRQFAAQCDAYAIDYHLEEYPGGHGGQSWRFIDRIQLMLTKMHESSDGAY